MFKLYIRVIIIFSFFYEKSGTEREEIRHFEPTIFSSSFNAKKYIADEDKNIYDKYFFNSKSYINQASSGGISPEILLLMQNLNDLIVYRDELPQDIAIKNEKAKGDYTFSTFDELCENTKNAIKNIKIKNDYNFKINVFDFDRLKNLDERNS